MRPSTQTGEVAKPSAASGYRAKIAAVAMHPGTAIFVASASRAR